MRLEPRRVLSVNASFVLGTLDVGIVNDGNGGTTASLHDLGAGQFFLDTNGNNAFDAASEITGAKTDLHQIIVKGDAGVGNFFWNDDFSTAPLDNSTPNSVALTNLNAAHLSATANIIGDVSINAAHVTIDGILAVDGNLSVSHTANSSSVTIDTGAQLGVTGQTTLSAGTFDQSASSLLSSDGDVNIDVKDHATIDGVIEANAGSIRIHTAGSGISMAATGELHALDDVTLISESKATSSIFADDITAGGDILLYASGDVRTNGAIESTGGDITLEAGRAVVVFDDVETSSTGTILLTGDAVRVEGSVTADDDVLLTAVHELVIQGDVKSNGGQVGISSSSPINFLSSSHISGADVFVDLTGILTADGQIKSTGDIAISTNLDFINHGSVVAAGNIGVDASRSIQVGYIQANNVSLQAGGNIEAGNAGLLGINLRADQLQMVAVGRIGASDAANGNPDANANAISLDVGTIAAQASSGIYLRSEGSLEVGPITAFSSQASVQVDHLHRDGSPSQVTTRALAVDSVANASEDLTATTGPIKVRVDAGNLIVESGTTPIAISADGDVLLWAQSIQLNGGVESTSGQIELRATDDISTTASINASRGTLYIHCNNVNLGGDAIAKFDILVDAANYIEVSSTVRSNIGQVGLRGNDITVNSPAIINGISILAEAAHDITLAGALDSPFNIVVDAGNDILMSGQVSGKFVAMLTGNDMLLGQIQALEVTLSAGRNILDNNAGVVNVDASRLQMSAGGSIGASSLASPVDTNPAAIDLAVTRIAAHAVNGIYLQEVNSANGELQIGNIGSISASASVQVNRVNFNSTPANPIAAVTNDLASDPSIQELVSTAGAIKVRVDSGNLIVKDNGVSANGDVLLWASDSIVLNGDVTSTANSIELRAANDIFIGASLSASNGTLYVHSSTISVNGANIVGSDVLLNAANTLTIRASVTSSNGQIGLVGRDVQIAHSSLISGVGVYVNAANNLTVSGAIDSQADVVLIAGNDIDIGGSVSAVGVVAARSGNDILLAEVRGQAVTLDAVGSILDNNGDALNIQANRLQMSAGGSIGSSSLISPVDLNPSAIDLIVGTVAARAVNGIYLQEIASASGNLTIGNVGVISGSVVVQANRVNFNSSPSTLIPPVTGNVTSNASAQEDLVSSTGSVKVKVDAGSLTVQDGPDANSIGVSAANDVLLWASQSITVNGSVVSAIGQIELRAVDNIETNSLVSANAGTVYIHSNSVTLSGVVSAQLDVLVDANNLLSINSNVSSTSGQVGLRADDVEINAASVVSGVGVYADADRDLTIAGSLNSSADVVLVADRDIVMSGNAIASDVVAVRAAQDILLGQVQGDAVTLTAGRNILDNNAAAVNVQADRLQMVAGGSIGSSSLASPVDANPAAIDLIVNTVAARAGNGIYLQEVTSANGDLRVGSVGTISGSVSVDVNRVSFNSSQATLIAPVVGSVASNPSVQEDLTATAGAVKVKVDAGSLIVDDGPDANSTGVSTRGDVLLWAADSISLSGVVESTAGQIELRAVDNINLNGAIAANGTLYIHANDITLGANVVAGADVLVDAIDSAQINANLSSSTGQVGLRANDLSINSASTVSGRGILADAANNLTLAGTLNSSVDVVLIAGNDIVMSGQAIASDVVAAQAGNDILLGRVQGQAVTLTSGGSILDNNASAVNVQADRLQMSSGGSIGASSLASPVDTNPAAIDLMVGTVAARSANGIYLQEVSSGSGNLQIGNVGTIAGDIAVQVNRVSFNSSPATLMAPVTGSVTSDSSIQEDLVASAGAVKVKVDNGSLTITDGPDANSTGVSASGDVLLWASKSISVNGEIVSTNGQLELRAVENVISNSAVTATVGTIYINADDVTLNQAVSAGADILVDAVDSIAVNSSVTSTNGQVGLRASDINVNASGTVSGVGIYANAANSLTLAGAFDSSADVIVITGNDLVMSGQITAAGTIAARAGDDILLGRLEADAVTLTATRNILDNNGSTVNVIANRLQMLAGGSIGASSILSPVDTNPAAIDLMVGTVAARASNGIYLQELASASGDLKVGDVGVVSGSVNVQVNRVNFNSSPSNLITPFANTVTGNPASQEDLVASAGAVKVKVDAGSLTIEDGADANTLGVSASGDVLLWASQSITVNGGVVSTAGQIELRATDDITSNRSISANVGSVYIHSREVTLNSNVSVGSDVLVDAIDSLGVNANVSSVGGQVGLRANDIVINSTAQVSGIGIYADAANDLTLSGSLNSSAGIVLIVGNDLVMTGQAIATNVAAVVASNDILLGRIQGQAVTLTAARDILDNNGAAVNVQADRLQMSAGGSIGTSSLLSPVDANPAAIDLNVGTVAAKAANGIYLQEVSSASGDLRIGNVGSISGTVTVQPNRVSFNSSPAAPIAPLTGTVSSDASAQEDLVTTAGSIKVKVDAGSLTVDDGPDVNSIGVSANRDILLWAAQSITLNGGIQSNNGQIELQAGANVVSNGTITASSGTTYIHSSNITLSGSVLAQSDVLADAVDSLTINSNVTSIAGQVGLQARNLAINATGLISGVGIYADADNDLTLSGSVNSSADAVIVAGHDIVMTGQATAANVVAAKAGNDILLGQIQGQAVTLTSGRNILDNNGATVNVQADRLQMLAGGSIGASSLLSPVGTNPAAIDLVVGTVAAKSTNGIYLQEIASASGDLSVGSVGVITGTVFVQVNRVNFNSSPSTLIAPITASVTSDTTVQEDLVSTVGAVKVKVDAGSLVIQDGPDANSVGLTAGGDILLWASQSITTNGSVLSAAGQVELRAVENITGNETIAANSGMVYINSKNITLNRNVSAASDILIDAADTLIVNQNINSVSGQVGLMGTDVTINAAGTINGVGVYANAGHDLTITGSLSSSADVVLVASNDIAMSGQAVATNVVAARAGEDILLGRVQGQAVTLTAGRNILDNNGSVVNVKAVRLQMSAGGSIGTSSLASPVDTNPAAIDLNVDTVAACAANGIYLEEVSSASGDLRVGNVGTIAGNVAVQVNRVSFNSSPATPITPVVGTVTSNSAVQEDLVASGGAIKVKVDAGNLVVADGADVNSTGVVASGDILLWASQAITLDGGVVSSAGQVELQAATDITSNASISSAGSLYIHASDITLNSAASAGQDLLADATDQLIVNSNVSTPTGQIGLRARDVVINSSGLVNGSGVFADASNNLTLAGTLNSSADIVLSAGNDVLMSGQATASNVVAARAGNDILLGRVQGQAVTLTAGRNILDNNAGVVNVLADRLQMVAGGSIGTSSLSAPVDTNPAAIDLNVGTVAAQATSGIYLQELSSANGDLTIGNVGTITGSVVVQVNKVNFNSSPSTLLAPITASVSSNPAVQEDLATTTGAIKVKVDAGSLIVTDGPDANTFAVSTTTGDILLWASNDLEIQSRVLSNAGDITLRSGGEITVGTASGISTGGSTYMIGGPIVSNAAISGAEGVLVRSGQDLLINQTITSSSGSVGIIAVGRISQNANITAADDLFVQSGGDFVMAATTTSTASNNAVVSVGGDVRVSVIAADRIGIVAQGNMIDSLANDQANLRGSQAILRAGGSIGQSFETNGLPDQNARSIGLDLQSISTTSGSGTYLNHITPGGTLRVAPVDSIASSLNIHQAQFNSSNTSVSLAGLPLVVSGQQDTTSGGVYKLVSSNGSLLVQDGTDVNTLEIIASGDVLLRASGNITLVGGVQSSSGNVALQAVTFIDVNASISANQNVLLQSDDIFVRQAVSAVGNVLVQASDSIELSGQIVSSGGSIGLVAAKDVLQSGSLNANKDLLISADTGVYQMSGSATSVAGNNALVNAANGIVLTKLTVARDAAITTPNGDIVGIQQSSANIDATNLSLRALNGRIGVADSLGSNFNAIGFGSVNTNALDINVTSTLAATSKSGIYLNEVSTNAQNLHVGRVNAVNVAFSSTDVNFNSTRESVSVSRTADALEYINTQTSQAGSSRAIDLRNQNGSITVNDSANVSRDGILANDGSIYISTNLRSARGDAFILLGESVRSLGAAERGNVGLRSFDWISDSNPNVSVVGTNLQIQSQAFTHLAKTVVDTLSADVGRPGTLADFQKVNLAASDRGDDFLSLIDMPGQSDDQFYSGNPTASNRVDPENFRFADRLAGSYSLYLVNSKSLTVNSVIGDGSSPNVYIETLGATDLVVHGTIATFSNTSTEGAIVLVAGRNLVLDLTAGSTSQLMTQSILADGQTRMQVINQFGSGDFIFDVKAFAGGDGIDPRSQNTTTEFVVDDRGELTRLSLLLADPNLRNRTDVFQRVVMQFGNQGESGFNIYLRYADGFGQEFNTLGDVGVRSILNDNNNLPANDNSIDARLASDNRAAVLSRIIAFESQFLFANENLPTLGIIRRADDFFLFQNASDASGVVDMTYETFNVDNVKSRGSEMGFTQILQDTPQIVPPAIVPPPELELIQTNLPPTIRLDLPVATEKQFEIAIYRVHFDDANQNGYADDNELPSSEQVLQAQELEPPTGQQSMEPAKGYRFKIESLSTGSGAPTSQQVEELKAQLMNDPDTPTGAYSIVENDSNDSQTVLDIFSVRDEAAQDYQAEERVPLVRPRSKGSEVPQTPPNQDVPQLPGENDSSFNEPQTDSPTSSRLAALASSGTLAAAFWYSRRMNKEDSNLLEELGNESSKNPIKLNRSARRNRRLASLLASNNSWKRDA